VDTKTCSRCLTPKPLAEFRRRGRNDPAPAAHCKDCHRTGVRKWRDRQRLSKAKRFAQEIGKADDDQKVIRATTAAVAAFRGVLGLASAFKETYESAPVGSPTRGKVMIAMLRLTEVASPLAHRDKNLLSDEDLDRQMAACEKRIADRIIASRNAGSAASDYGKARP